MQNFYKDKTVLVTGHNGFKGSWLCLMLYYLGANIIGYSKDIPYSNPSLFAETGVKQYVNSIKGDIADYNILKETFDIYQPEIVFHLAAQPLVIQGYKEPHKTFETNIMGTTNVLECCRLSKSVKSIVVITTDKVYDNQEWPWSYRENDKLGGHDPYSLSKSMADNIATLYSNLYFKDMDISCSIARAGNVIGGGDFAENRIIPDCVRAIQNNEPINIRNPYSIRPYQHVLDVLYGYLTIAKEHYCKEGAYNIGPNSESTIHTIDLVNTFFTLWGKGEYKIAEGEYKESDLLQLDSTLMKKTFNWTPKMNIEETLKETVFWYQHWLANDNMNKYTFEQIKRFFNG